jgi:hypothetical protein
MNKDMIMDDDKDIITMTTSSDLDEREETTKTHACNKRSKQESRSSAHPEANTGGNQEDPKNMGHKGDGRADQQEPRDQESATSTTPEDWLRRSRPMTFNKRPRSSSQTRDMRTELGTRHGIRSEPRERAEASKHCKLTTVKKDKPRWGVTTGGEITYPENEDSEDRRTVKAGNMLLDTSADSASEFVTDNVKQVFIAPEIEESLQKLATSVEDNLEDRKYEQETSEKVYDKNWDDWTWISIAHENYCSVRGDKGQSVENKDTADIPVKDTTTYKNCTYDKAGVSGQRVQRVSLRSEELTARETPTASRMDSYWGWRVYDHGGANIYRKDAKRNKAEAASDLELADDLCPKRPSDTEEVQSSGKGETSRDRATGSGMAGVDINKLRVTTKDEARSLRKGDLEEGDRSENTEDHAELRTDKGRIGSGKIDLKGL